MGLSQPKDRMIDESRCLLNDLLCAWHRWASGYQHVGGIASSPMFRGMTPNKTREDDDAVDGAIHNATCEAINHQVMEMDPVHRTILQLQARNLHSGVSVWSSPRLPADPEERAVVLMEARNRLTKRLIFCGVI
jgi:hypothetical protein